MFLMTMIILLMVISPIFLTVLYSIGKSKEIRQEQEFRTEIRRSIEEMKG